MNQVIAVRLLQRFGRHVVTARTGREVLQAMQTDSFDVVLMDVHMPEMDGLAATAAIREMEKAAGGHVPIIAMTANAMQGDREQCVAAGMDDYISQPIRSETLSERLQGVRLRVHTPAARPLPSTREPIGRTSKAGHQV